MKFRIAKYSDYKILAKIHSECGKVQVGGFMHKLGLNFLNEYYKLFLKEKSSIIVIAEDSNDIVLGFSSGTLDAGEHLNNLKSHRLRLAISTIPAILARPGLVKELLFRKRFVSSQESTKIIINEGARGEYWAWLPGNKNQIGSGILRQSWINILMELGCKSFKYELDTSNTSFERYSKIFGCRLIEEITLPDGRKRAFVEQILYKKK